MFKKILIANRGEIACRVIKTAQKMGIYCIAVYSTIDEYALHVQMADEAHLLGDAPSQDSYLCADKIITIAKQAGAEAIHPGYGFLSENALFANACQQAGIVFIGPSGDAILAMGSKSHAKAIMTQAGVPCTPGYHGDNQDADFLLKEAEKIGFPVLIKATMGGGGKGMRKVDGAKSFKAALASAQREAQASFGDKTVLLEKYLLNPRHIEVQIMADSQNNALYLFERDCSIQRRHQKIIEEAPGLNISEALRAQMGNAAVQAAKAIHYCGAGTIEFLLDADQNFYFMEMNTRLQVEHPVTEMITGLDLVSWQLHIATGKTLPYQQKDLQAKGHAIEVRLYAEDPYHDFLPATGKIHDLSWPTLSQTVRIDSGIQAHDTISTYYDPMIAKLIVHGNTREKAIAELKKALKQLHIIGVKNNRHFLRTLIDLPDYIEGKITTSFIPDHEKQLNTRPTPKIEIVLCAAALYSVIDAPSHITSSEDVFSPWGQRNGFRLQLPYQQTLHFKYNDELYAPTLLYQDDSTYILQIEDARYTVKIYEHTLRSICFAINDVIQTVQIICDQKQLWIIHDDDEYVVQILDALSDSHTLHEKTGHLNAPMPGAIVAVNVKAGDNVQKDDCLMVMEAMKMEHSIYAPYAGVVREVFFAPGDRVDEGAELLAFD